MPRTDQALNEVYGKQDLGVHPYFTGDFINFGFWRDSQITGVITQDDRTRASQRLYQYLFESMQMNSSDTICEIGFGHGMGLLTACQLYGFSECNGIDLQQAQVNRAKVLTAKHSREIKFNLQQGSAEATGLLSSSISKVFSVEAAQHFPSIPLFLKEMHRILRPRGRLGVTTMFPITNKSLGKLPQEVPDLDLELHPMSSMEQIEKYLHEGGFTLIKNEQIGRDVFPGFQKWINQSGVKETWGPIWLQAFEKGLMDYYLFVAQKK